MPRVSDAEFERNVFINCPFDDDYDALLRPLLFTIIYFGYNPRISSERSDSAEQRIEKICEFIGSSKYSIHDLSRLKSKEKDELARHNMPFELGVDYGSRKFTNGRFKLKRFLVLEKDRYEYAKALSDLAGVDIKKHDNKPLEIIRAVRNWFYETVGAGKLESPSVIHGAFIDFMAAFDVNRKYEGYAGDEIYKMPTTEFMTYIRAWLKAQRKVKKKTAKAVAKAPKTKSRSKDPAKPTKVRNESKNSS